MTAKTFTVTVDGKPVGKRTSKTRDYTHAVLLTAQDPAAVIAAEEWAIRTQEAEITKLRKALETPTVRIRARFRNSGDLSYNGQPVYSNYEIWLEGAGEHGWHSNSKGEVKGGNRIYTAKEFLTARAAEAIATRLTWIKKSQARIDALKAGDTSTLRGLTVLSWHTSGPLAAKAASAAQSYHAGSTAYVLPVDAK